VKLSYVDWVGFFLRQCTSSYIRCFFCCTCCAVFGVNSDCYLLSCQFCFVVTLLHRNR